MNVCPKHPYSIVSSIGCPLCEGQRLAELDRRAGRRFERRPRHQRTSSINQFVVTTVRDIAQQVPDIPLASAGDRIWLRKAAS